jgi:hypothetical protein
MALTLANMLARVKRNVPTTTMDTELQDAILERMNYLVSLDAFPFQEGYQTTTVTSDYRVATPDNFAYLRDLVIWESESERHLTILDPVTFDQMFPKPDENDTGTPTYCCVRIAEGEFWFNCPVDSMVIRAYFYKIPDDATDTTVSQLTELAKITLEKWASADGFRMMGEHDRADRFEAEGNKIFQAMKKRYQLSREEGTQMISAKYLKKIYTGH